jgi:carbonic anhydrase
MDKLIEGYHRFYETNWEAERARWRELQGGQKPRIMVIACSDSRVDPATIFDTSPGEMFVVRNVAALVPPFEFDGGRHGVSAALEFAVTQLEVPQVMVMGHGGCGGVAAALTRKFEGARAGEGGFIAHWIDLLDAARDKVSAKHGEGPAAVRALELEAVKVSIANLRSFPDVAAREAEGTLRLEGAYFALDEGVLYLLDATSGDFRPA